jgi:hypothetical protein
MLSRSPTESKAELSPTSVPDPYIYDKENIIKTTRHIIKHMTQEQRFEKAKAHVLDSLSYRSPRPDSESLDTPTRFRIVYAIETSSLWQWMLFILSYVFMYFVIADSDDYSLKLGVESTILIIFWVDTFFRKYIKTFDHFGKHAKQVRYFGLRALLLLLLTIDLLIFAGMPNHDSRPIRLFRILRACTSPAS